MAVFKFRDAGVKGKNEMIIVGINEITKVGKFGMRE